MASDLLSVTFDADAASRGSLPPNAEAAVIGLANDGVGLEALVVAIDGSCDRPDGSVFHVTWSLEADKGRKAAESNALLARLGWRKLAAPIEISLIPARF